MSRFYPYPVRHMIASVFFEDECIVLDKFHAKMFETSFEILDATTKQRVYANTYVRAFVEPSFTGVLIDLDAGRYVHIGDTIFEFSLKQPVVGYMAKKKPYALTWTHVFLIDDHIMRSLPLELVEGENPWDVFHETRPDADLVPSSRII